MSKDFEVFENDEDALIEYVSEAEEVSMSEQMEEIPSTSSSAVLKSALRSWPLTTRKAPDYNLVDDLRGHMVQHHKFPLVENDTQAEAKTTNAQQTLQVLETDPESDEELPPMPFKDFRLILRENMNLRCKTTTRCKFTFENQEKLEKHMKCHSNDKNFCCHICNIKAINWRRCSAHLWKEHQENVDLLKCPLCDFEAQTSVLVWRHMRVHSKWRPLVLRTLKGKQAKKQRTNAKQPMDNTVMETKTVANKNKYYSEKTCEICNRKFVNGKTLSKHVKAVHRKLKPFICNVCGKKTSRKVGLEVTIRARKDRPL